MLLRRGRNEKRDSVQRNALAGSKSVFCWSMDGLFRTLGVLGGPPAGALGRFFASLGCLGGGPGEGQGSFGRLWKALFAKCQKYQLFGSHFGAPNGPKKHEKTFKKTASSSAVFLSMLWVVFSCFRDHFLRPRTLRNGGFVSTGAVFLATG